MSTNMLTWNIDKITELKFKILEDRNYKIPKEFYYMIDDELIIHIAEHGTIDNDNMVTLVCMVTNDSGRNYKYAVTSLIERGLPEFLYVFSPYHIVSYINEREYADSVIVPWISVYFKKKNYHIPEILIITYLKLKLSKFLRPWYILTNKLIIAEVKTLIHNLSKYSGISEDFIITKILPIVYGMAQFRYMDNHRYDIRDVIITRDEYYEAGGDYMWIYSSPSSLYYFLKNYVKKGFTFEISTVLCNDMKVYYNDIECMNSGSVGVQKLLIETIRLNPNNLRLLEAVWFMTITSEMIDQIIDILLSSKIVINDYSIIHNFFSVIPSYHGNYDNTIHSIIVHFLKIGMPYSAILPYYDYAYIIDNLALCVTYCSIDDIQSVILHPKFYDLHDTDICGPKTIGDYILEYILPSLNYRIHLKVYKAILSNEEVYKTISKKNMNRIFNDIDINEMINEYPNIVGYENIQTYLGTIPFGNITNPMILSYLPYNMISKNVLTKYVIADRKYIPLTYTGVNKMTGAYVCSLLDKGVGYGYILDLPTKLQMDQVINYYISDDTNQR